MDYKKTIYWVTPLVILLSVISCCSWCNFAFSSYVKAPLDYLVNNFYLECLWNQFDRIDPKVNYKVVKKVKKVGIIQGHGHCDYYVGKVIQLNSIQDFDYLERFYSNKNLYCLSHLVTWEEAKAPPVQLIPCSKMAKEENYLFKIENCTNKHLVLVDNRCIGTERNNDPRCHN